MGIQDIQGQGWGVPVPMAVPPPQAAAAPAPPQQAPYVPIGAAPPSTFPNLGQTPSTNPGDSQAAAEAALQASLSDGGHVAGKGAAAAGAGGAALLPPAAAGVATKAGMRPSAESVEVKEGVPVTPELAGSEDAVRAAGADVAEDERAVGVRQPVEQNVRNQEQAINDARLAEAEANRQRDFQKELADERWKRDKAHAAYDMAASTGIDPDHYWKEKSTGGTLATLLSLMAGGFVSGMNGGPNQALEQLNKNIDRDISAQRENLGTKKGQQDDADTHMDLFTKEGMDKDQAAAAGTVLARQNFAKQLDAKYTATSNAMGKLTIAKAIQDNAAKMAEAEQGYQKLTADSVTKKVDEKYQEATGGGSGGPTRKAVSELAAKLISDGKYSSPDDAMRAAGHLLGFDPAGAAPVPSAQAKPGSDKVSPRLGVRLSTLQQAGSSLKAVSDLENGSWITGLSQQLPGVGGAPAARGADAVAKARTAMAQSGIDQSAIDEVLPKDYNPVEAHISGKYNERLKDAADMIAHQKTVIQGAVDMSKGGGAPADDAGP